MKFVLLGLGIVGKGVLEQYRKERAQLAQDCGADLELVGVFDRSWRKKKEILGHTPAFDENFELMLETTKTDVVIEVTGAMEPAHEWISTALKRGKHVITANKALLAQHGNELFALSKKKQCFLLFEAAVGGALPLIKNFQYLFGGENFQAIYGILNSTSNFILSRMMEGIPFHEALVQAQEQGFAEANPSADILGHDAAQKITLLSSLLFRKKIDLTSVQTEGIAHIQPQDLRISSALNYVLRPIVFSKKLPDGSILSGVRNTLLAKTHTLATIRDSLNAVLIQSKYAKNTLIVGEGAGSYPTASAILSDLIFLHKMQNLSIQNPFAESAPFTESSSFAESSSFTESSSFAKDSTATKKPVTNSRAEPFLVNNQMPFYMRLTYNSKSPQDLSVFKKNLKKILEEKHKIPIARVREQTKEVKNKPDKENLEGVVLITGNCNEETIWQGITEIKKHFEDCQAVVFPILTVDL